jgi:calcium-dependent protein kinase
MDINGDGQLTIEELKDGLKEIPDINLDEKDIIEAMKVIDANGNGLIDYTEFIAACLHSYNYLQDTQLRSAFSYFDKDGNGTISKEELRECLESDDFLLNEEEINKLIEGVDINNDGEIDYLEFITMMKAF